MKHRLALRIAHSLIFHFHLIQNCRPLTKQVRITDVTQKHQEPMVLLSKSRIPLLSSPITDTLFSQHEKLSQKRKSPSIL